MWRLSLVIFSQVSQLQANCKQSEYISERKKKSNTTLIINKPQRNEF